jgi:hypothetical protein
VLLYQHQCDPYEAALPASVSLLTAALPPCISAAGVSVPFLFDKTHNILGGTY